MPTSYTRKITPEQADALRQLMERQGFEFAPRDWTLFAGKKGKLQVSVYEKGPKVLVQGKDTDDFVSFHLEPEILGVAELGYEEINHPEMFEPHIGVDESGKGDFFGPLVVAGTFTDESAARTLIDAGIMDSKRIGSDNRIRTLANEIRAVPGIAHEVITIGPARYNELYKKFRNLNRLLAWGHARVIENLLEKHPECPRALSDQFANPRELQRAMMERGKKIQLAQRVRAESDPAVAAASILAREAFVNWLDAKGQEIGITLPKGASAQVKTAARKAVAQLGANALPTLAKMHFKTAGELIP